VKLRVAAVVAAGWALGVAAVAAGSPAPGTIVTLAQLAHPRGLAVLPDGSVLVPEPFADDVVKVAPDGAVTRVAGTGVAGYSGDGGPAVDAELDLPHSVALLPDGSFLIADALNNRIRRVDPNGTISTYAGDGRHGFSGDGGQALDAEIGASRGIATTPGGTLFIADSDNDRIRRVTPEGTISTVAGDGSSAVLDLPFFVAPLADGSLVVADTGNSRIRLVSADGTITTVAGDGRAGYGGDGKAATAAEVNHPHSVLPLPAGGFLVADTGNHRVREVWPDGTITTIAGTGTPGYSGDDGPATSAQLDEPKALALLPDGRILVADSSNDRLRVITPVPPAAPRLVSVAVRGGATLDVRFRVCDASRAPLLAELHVTGRGTFRSVVAPLVSTRGGCLPYRLQVDRARASTLRLRIRDDDGLWSATYRRLLR
jgi:serine/threonine-protein kinase